MNPGPIPFYSWLFGWMVERLQPGQPPLTWPEFIAAIAQWVESGGNTL